MERVTLYNIPAAQAEQSSRLLSADRSFFFAAEPLFQHNDPGDRIFVVSRAGAWALYGRLGRQDIPASPGKNRRTVSFEEGGQTYTVPREAGRPARFVRIDVVQHVGLPAAWNWSAEPTPAEITDLWSPAIADPEHRIDAVYDLIRLFSEGEAATTLQFCRRGLLEGRFDALETALHTAINAPANRRLAAEPGFAFLLGQQALRDLLDYKPELPPDFFRSLAEQFRRRSMRPVEFLEALPPGSDEWAVLDRIFTLVAYCDEKAAQKNERNRYADRRVLGQAAVRQGDWVLQLLFFRAAGGRLEAVTADSVRNALRYLQHPEAELTMMSEQHRQLVARHVLKLPAYEAETFTDRVLEFFQPFHLRPANPLNLTRLISNVLYHDRVRELWFERVAGLVGPDGAQWLEAATLAGPGQAVLIPAEKLPGGGQPVLQLLQDTLKKERSFPLYLARQGQAHHRLRVVDFATEKDYAQKEWATNGDLAGHRPNFQDYRTADGRPARIVYLAEAPETVPAIPLSAFEFYGSRSEPALNAPQPFRQLQADSGEPWSEEGGPTEALIFPDFGLTGLDKTIGITRSLLLAIKTKPFVLLAGLSGTGKSRLARTLAYHTCSDPALQGDKPGNFELIKVRPNWHDSSELVGYVTRIGGERYVITPFLHFLVRAWQHPGLPFILCLDEMNLAPVEQYFAEYLSVLETRRPAADGTVRSDALVDAAVYRCFAEQFDVECGVAVGGNLHREFARNGLTLPPNLAVIGTVNMDETTHAFSRKVLDRAMTIEMNEIDLWSGLEEESPAWAYPDAFLAPAALSGELTRGGPAYATLGEDGPSVVEFLENLNALLRGTPFQVAYRVRDEFLIYCYHAFQLTGKPGAWLTACLDELTFMKVLARIEGDEARVGPALQNLRDGLPGDRYPQTAAKLREMQERLWATGYTSFWS
jgi:hypothetical protein